MATIKACRQANGTIRYSAIARKYVGKAIVHREARTFTRRPAAVSFAKHREVELEEQRHVPVTVAEPIRWYIDTFEPRSKWHHCKQSHLEFLERHALGKGNALNLSAAADQSAVRAGLLAPHPPPSGTT